MPSKNIVLLDYSLDGHHLSFLRSFSKILLDQGHRVICIAPGIEKVKSWIFANAPNRLEHFYAMEYRHEPVGYTRLGKLNETAAVVQKWRYDAALIKRIEKSLGIGVDLVFYAWLDTQLAGFIPSFLLDALFPYKWSGLYFHPYHLRREEESLKRKAVWRDWDAIFLSRGCIGVTLHDQGIKDKFSWRINKPVIHFPETADDSDPDLSYPLYKEIMGKAAGRKVVGMIGCEAHKGTLTMVRMIRLADPGKYYFVFLGTLPESTYTTNDWKELQTFIAENRENCYFRFEPIPEGGAYNAVFCSFDIPFLVYDDFISSSNRLTKAAIFERLVLASNNYCVGEDVQQYDLGEAVEPMNAKAALVGLEKLAQRVDTKAFPYDQWKAYRNLNSEEKLKERFSELIALL